MKKRYKKMPEIYLSKVKLRTIEKKDYLDMYDYGKSHEVTRYLSWGPFTDKKQALYAINHIFKPRLRQGLPIGYAIIDLNTQKMIGTIDFHSKIKGENGAEIGYALHQDFWNQGIMTEALLKMIDIGFNYLGYDFIKIRHLKGNIASEKVIQKTPFKRVFEAPYTLEKAIGIYPDVMVHYVITKENYNGNQ
ncbi:MAG: hypothetical protein CVV61_07065 [Tenericutes bacterium HGW-Tenericutes-6]|nr:MAG: hypothetical protein CVV61_07065 [Tenericutes bacterium HGW-Tenericutes-6]